MICYLTLQWGRKTLNLSLVSEVTCASALEMAHIRQKSNTSLFVFIFLIDTRCQFVISFVLLSSFSKVTSNLATSLHELSAIPGHMQ